MRAIIVTLFCLVSTSSVLAATIHLKDGRTVTGAIVEQSAQALRVESNGAVMTYFADEISDVDGKPLNAAPVAAKPVALPVAPKVKQSPVVAVTGEKRALILKFMEVFGTKQALEQNFQYMIEQTAKQKPEEAQKIKDRIKLDEIVEELLPIYDHNFSATELQAMIDFYSSAPGKKLMSTIPTLMRESVEVSTRYIQRKFPELSNE